MIKTFVSTIAIALSFLVSSLQAYQSSYEQLLEQYVLSHERPSDINEHLPTLRKYAADCSTVVELGLRNAVSTWGLLLGLAESDAMKKGYIGVDITLPEAEILEMTKGLAEANGIRFQFWHKDDRDIEIEETDLLMIDTLHIYAQLTFELEKFSPKVLKYIIMHDTSYPFEYQDERPNTGINYPFHIDRNKRGLWPAIVDFLVRHPEWSLHERFSNNYGLTVLKRR
jgi:hypothetical protein